MPKIWKYFIQLFCEYMQLKSILLPCNSWITLALSLYTSRDNCFIKLGLKIEKSWFSGKMVITLKKVLKTAVRTMDLDCISVHRNFLSTGCKFQALSVWASTHSICRGYKDSNQHRVNWLEGTSNYILFSFRFKRIYFCLFEVIESDEQRILWCQN